MRMAQGQFDGITFITIWASAIYQKRKREGGWGERERGREREREYQYLCSLLAHGWEKNTQYGHCSEDDT